MYAKTLYKENEYRVSFSIEDYDAQIAAGWSDKPEEGKSYRVHTASAPQAAVLAGTSTAPAGNGTPGQPAALAIPLNKMNKTQLIERAAALGLSTEGTNAELADRISATQSN